MIRIAMDCLGGDHSPDANIEGGVMGLAAHPDLQMLFLGDEAVVKNKLEELKAPMDRCEIVHAPDVVTGEDRPLDAVRMKRDSSMIRGIKLLREDEDLAALISTGASGTLVSAATLRIGRIEGVHRPAFCPVIPTMHGGIVAVCDSGANIDCSPEQLQQFALMGSAYLSCTFGIENPRVALLNVGVESEKGDDLRRAAYALLKETEGLNFVGNMESRDFLSGKYDLVVSDGFSGNVLIKSTEGACLEMLMRLKRDISSRFVNKIGALFMYKTLMKEKKFMNYQNYGGSVLLGSEKIIVKGHGSSKATAVSKCVDQAYTMITSGLREKIAESIGKNIKTTEETQNV